MIDSKLRSSKTACHLSDWHYITTHKFRLLLVGDFQLGRTIKHNTIPHKSYLAKRYRFSMCYYRAAYSTTEAQRQATPRPNCFCFFCKVTCITMQQN